MSDKDEALLLADALEQQAAWETRCGPSELGELLPDAAALLRRQHAEIESLKAECDALRADAERWRYVRRKVCFSGIGNGKAHMYIINLPISETFPEIGQHEVCADAAIDAAREEAGK